MEFNLSGNALKTFVRSITCLARIGNELVLQATPSQLMLHTLNSSRSAYQSVTFKPDFFDVYTTASDTQVQCSVLLKAVCSVLRTPIASIDHLTVLLADSDSSKVQWALDCYSGMKKSYWITCNIEPEIQHLSLDRRNLPSNLAVRPRDLNRLLANFQSTLQEITLIATQASASPSDSSDQVGGKSVELRSYLDPTKENDLSLHTQLWIDPVEEFMQYTHAGDPVDVTFGMKELKAFLSYCEGCEVDVHIFFDKAGEPILMAPKFGFDDGSSSNFDATLVLATMLVSQLNDRNVGEPAPAMQGSKGNNTSEHPSDHTRIWSELSGSNAKGGNGFEGNRQAAHGERNPDVNQQRTVHQRISEMNIASKEKDVRGGPSNLHHHREEAINRRKSQDVNTPLASQYHPSNWLDGDEDDDGGEADLRVTSTPP